MKIEFTGQKIGFKMRKAIKRAVKLTLDHLKQEHKKMLISIAFVLGEEIKDLNKRTREKDQVTDVLSYPNHTLKPFDRIDVNCEDNYIGKYVFLGDMAICLSQAEEQALEFGHSLQDEVVKLVVHSVLHMMGFDHIDDDDYRVMNQEEEKIASKFYTNKKI